MFAKIKSFSQFLINYFFSLIFKYIKCLFTAFSKFDIHQTLQKPVRSLRQVPTNTYEKIAETFMIMMISDFILR